MSLEEALKANTEAVLKLAAITENLAALRADAIESVKAAASTGKPAAAAKAEKAAAAEKTTAAATTPAETPAAAAEGEVSDEKLAALTEKIKGYLTSTDREEERAARKGKIIALLGHEQIRREGVAADAAPDTKNIKPSAIKLFEDNLDGLIAKGDLTEVAAASTSLV